MDAQAATHSWLARLPAPDRLAAQAATDVRLAGWIAGALVFLLVAGLLARFDAAGAAARRIEAGAPRPWLAAAVAGGLTALALALANAGVDAVTGWRVDAILRAGAVPPAGLPSHLAAAASGVAPSVLAAALFFPPLVWLMRRAPKRWPLIAGGPALALVVALGWLPYALMAGPPASPAPPGPAEAGVAQLVAETRLPAPAVLLVPDPAFDADVTGGFGRARVTVGPMLLAGRPAEARADVGHLIGHYVHHDVLIVCLLAGAIAAAGFAAAQRFAAPLARAMGARGALGPADPAALPGLAVIGGATLTLAALAGGAYLRWANVGADAYSLDHAREPDGLAAVIEEEWRRDPQHLAVAPSAIETLLFYSHPPLEQRIAHAMAWKAAHALAPRD